MNHKTARHQSAFLNTQERTKLHYCGIGDTDLLKRLTACAISQRYAILVASHFQHTSAAINTMRRTS